MSAMLNITTSVQGDSWVLQLSVAPLSDIPSDIFLCQNTGTTALGPFFCIASYTDYIRFQDWTGAILPIFGNNYVKCSSATQMIPITADPVATALGHQQSAQYFRAQYLNATLPSTKGYPL